MSRTVAIIQARFAATRLPGKALLTLGGRPVLEHVIARCAAIPSVDAVCCATSDGADCDQVAEIAARCGVHVFRGDEADVLGRYRRAADDLGADVVLRVTADCPLLDPAVCDAVIRLRREAGVDYASNNRIPSWPHGLDCEAFSAAALRLADRCATLEVDREHVTYWITERSGLTVANLPGPGNGAQEHRLTLDYPEDHAFLSALLEHLPPWPALPSWQDVAVVLEQHPGLAAINRHRRHHAAEAKGADEAQSADRSRKPHG